jgi:hypothetical protein
MASPPATQATRRRQRSTRLTVAVGLLVAAALAVVGAAVSSSTVAMIVAGVAAVLLGAAATRITHSELADSRRDAARELAKQAQDYLGITEVRVGEQADFVETMLSRIAEREQALDELEQALGSAQKRAATATRKKNAEVRRAVAAERAGADLSVNLEKAELRIVELEQEIDLLRSELDSVTAAWRTADGLRRHA